MWLKVAIEKLSHCGHCPEDREIETRWQEKQDLLRKLKKIFPEHNFSKFSLAQLHQLYAKLMRERENLNAR